MPKITNDNERASARLREPDAYGQAAMLLTESLLHGLIARRVLTTHDAIEIVAVAAEVKEDIGDELGDTPATLRKSLALLAAIGSSLDGDVLD